MVDHAVAEIEFCGSGLIGMTFRPERYNGPIVFRRNRSVWSAAEDHDMTVAIHEFWLRYDWLR